MKTQSLLIKTSMYFLIVLFFSALTKPVAADQELEHRESQAEFEEQMLLVGFDGELDDVIQFVADQSVEVDSSFFATGVHKKSLRVGAAGLPSVALVDVGAEIQLDRDRDFTVEFWIRTTANSDDRFVVLSKKHMPDKSLASQKNKGWAFSVSHGTWAWDIGSGNRRLNYERANGQFMSVNDGRWHQLAMTHDHSRSLIRLYFDGVNYVTYNIADKDGFDFTNDVPLTIGWGDEAEMSDETLPAIKEGAENLQKLVDRFNRLELGELKPEELLTLVIGSERLIQDRVESRFEGPEELPQVELDGIRQLVRELSKNPYTVHQVADFMQVAPLLKLYRLKNGRIKIDRKRANEFARQERLGRPRFDMDELSIIPRSLSSAEMMDRYSRHFQIAVPPEKSNVQELTAASFNIHHGGKHETVEEDGWDSREVIADIIRRENIDVVMMQETYSSGDFIAAELGYYFATTVDWDYLNQGANISVLSRFPIKEITVPPSSSFMNVAARVAISETQEIHVMSNWYGMKNFQDVFAFHESSFSQSDNVPVLFAGDFNAVPHTDGGNSPASEQLLAAGFLDAFREMYPDVRKHPGPSHQGGKRIDQLYYKGRGLKNKSTEVLSTWPSKFPSDHYLIKTIFGLDFETKN